MALLALPAAALLAATAVAGAAPKGALRRTAASAGNDMFHPAGELGKTACRGDNPSDNSANYYTLHTAVESFNKCKALCVDDATCVGIEYSPKARRCEVWTREIGATTDVLGFGCFRYGSFQPVDGGSDRACRGANPSDNKDSYYTLHSGVESLDKCKALCGAANTCVGIEHSPTAMRCEVWTENIGASAIVAGFSCFRYQSGGPESQAASPDSFVPVDGGSGRACRRASSTDNSASYYTVHHGVVSLDNCKDLCGAATTCVGIEYNDDGRCEVWTENIGASASAAGFFCYARIP